MLRRMGGRLLSPDPVADMPAAMQPLLAQSHLVCSATPEIAGSLDLSTATAPRMLDHAVVRAAGGAAEAGSVSLMDKDLKVNALAYMAQHLIPLLDPADIVVNMHNAYARPEFRGLPYAVFHSGPSATADIQGVLILGALGVPQALGLICRTAEFVSVVRLSVCSLMYATLTMRPGTARTFAAPTPWFAAATSPALVNAAGLGNVNS